MQALQIALLRIQCARDLGQSAWNATFNGVTLTATEDRSEPFDNPYSPLLGTPEQHRAWVVPQEGIKNGVNGIEIVCVDGPGSHEIVFVDVAVE